MQPLKPSAPFPGSPDYFRLGAAALRPGLSPMLRVALAVIAVAGTVAYGVHVHGLLQGRGLPWLGPSIALGAGLSWVVLVSLAAATVRSPERLRRLADHALATLSLGMVGVLTAMAATMATAAPPLITHLVVLGLSDVAMGAYFVARAGSARLTAAAALAIWVGLMNGILAAVVVAGYLIGANP